MNIKKTFLRYKDVIAYLFFGGVTTLINITIYWLLAHEINIETIPSTIIAWIFSVLFAYLTNRKWVFKSDKNTFKAIIKELISFFSCRIATGVVDLICMYIFVDLIGLNDMVIKIMANIVVIVLNFIVSKIFIFKKVD